ncbi:UDP-glucose 4-epimerase GalE [Candidatus Sulfidibacterium hydrothermale]|jgi:UDP-glucose 4-epimerase|uniref:UDP-glucose 4-epimerase GalE n=1 Tax=Candidatus Sulfidibacterium hydrothermale TaxID=2875962 RepID=UPI001F0A5B9A|nr:UDP-glucose 4-epimerase GalE [Candidatus Sulfidibacterium hydrothermale]UBM63336.1 UDP-glucose 4-epimerase GalE [Candidatus Sulfidibacterium hydrothermale]
MKILVTGGTGYIGSHTVVELQNKGFEVLIVDNLSNSSAEIVDNIEKITGTRPVLEVFDLVDREKTADFFQRNNDIAGVIHFAAYKAVGESVEKPLMYYRNNLVSLMNILESMRDNNIQNLVFSSSCTVYGQPDELPVSEKAPIKKAESPYGNTKQISEEIIQDTIKASDIHGIALRYFNPIGAHESALIGELPLGVPNNLVPFITQTAIGIRDQLKVFGNDYPTPDGTPIRDYIHVVDLAKAHVIAVDRMIQDKMKKPFEVFNLGTGKGYSVLEVIKAFEKVSGLKLNYKIVGRREGDVIQVWADPSFSNRELGWKAEKGLEEMVASAWKWEQAYRKKLADKQ